MFTVLSLQSDLHKFSYVKKHFSILIPVPFQGTRTQPLICAGCSVHYWESCAINEEGFFVVVDTHLPRFEALAYVLPHFDALTSITPSYVCKLLRENYAYVGHF